LEKIILTRDEPDTWRFKGERMLKILRIVILRSRTEVGTNEVSFNSPSAGEIRKKCIAFARGTAEPQVSLHTSSHFFHRFQFRNPTSRLISLLNKMQRILEMTQKLPILSNEMYLLCSVEPHHFGLLTASLNLSLSIH
jgi:hypothetical protein